MYGYFTFDVVRDAAPRRHLILFCATSKPNVEDVISVIKRYGESALSPDAIILLGFESEQNTLNSIALDSRIADCIPLHTRNSSAPVVAPATIPRNGLLPGAAIGALSWREISLAGLSTIFTTRNALLVAPSTHHFSKPSKKHCDRFIRAANALVDGAEIAFIAATCLRYVSDSVRHFYCDTGGIAVLAFAIDSIRRRFDREISAATVNTFESYEGLKRFEFRSPDLSVVLVSASTSGNLEKEVCIREPRFGPSQIVTLFSIGERQHESPVLLDLEHDTEKRELLGEFTSFPASDCPLCYHGSIAVPMTGDQFIPIMSDSRTVLITRTHAPTWLLRFLTSMAGRHLLKAFFRSPHTLHASSDVFIDLEGLFRSSYCNDAMPKRIVRLINQSLPAATRRIVHLDDPASQLLAEMCAARLSTMHRDMTRVKVLSAKDLSKDIVGDDGATAVIGAAIASGHSLQSVSLALRSAQTTGEISYIIALARMQSPADIEKLDRDLRMGEMPTDFAVAIAERIFLPVVGRKEQSAWNEELSLLQELSDTTSGDLQARLEERIATLNDAHAITVRGLTDELFWPSRQEEELQLRHGFVFFPRDIPAATASQGDVYFTIVAVLHHLRTGAGPKSELRQTEYERRVLSPLCFDRFSDGVLQASLLRAVHRPELDFSSSPEESERMSSIVRTILGSAATPKGEASREFLLALALRRLCLLSEDLEKLHDDFAHSETDPISQLFWKTIKTRLLV